MDAKTMRGVLPNIASTAAWLASELSDGGKCTTTAAMTEANISAPKPAHTTRRSRPYPYTSVKISPKMYEIGKNNTPARKVMVMVPCVAPVAGPVQIGHVLHQRYRLLNSGIWME